MSGALNVITKPLGKVVGAATSLFTPKAPKIPGAQPTATRDDAADAVARDDELRRRRGSAANLLLGPSGAEAQAGTTATKMLTGQ